MTGIPSLNIPLPNPEKELFAGEADSNECSNDACEAASDQGLSCWFLYLIVALYWLIIVNLQTVNVRALPVWMTQSLVRFFCQQVPSLCRRGNYSANCILIIIRVILQDAF